MLSRCENRLPLLKEIVAGNREQRFLLGSLERLVGVINQKLLKQLPAILQLLYQHELVEEQVFLLWNASVSRKFVRRTVGEEVRQAAAPFIEWLQTEEDEESDDDTEEGDGQTLVTSNLYIVCASFLYITINANSISICIAADGLSLNHRVLLLILVHSPVIISTLMMAQQLHEFFVMRNDDQLKVALHPAIGNNPMEKDEIHGTIVLGEGVGKTLNVVVVEIGGGLIQGKDAAVDAKGFGQCQSYDQASQDPLSRTGSSPHVQLRVALDHHHTIIVGSGAPSSIMISPDLDRVNVSALIGVCPYFANNFVDFIHL